MHCNELYSCPQEWSLENKNFNINFIMTSQILQTYRVQDNSVVDKHGASDSTKEENQVVSWSSNITTLQIMPT